MALLLKYWPYVLGVVLLAASITWFSHARYSAGREAGRIEVMRMWDEHEAAEVAALEDMLKRVKQTEEAQARKAREQENAMQEKLDKAAADARSLSERLRRYQARRCEGAVPKTPAAPIVADGPGGITEDGGAIGEATDAHFAACARDAKRLNEWRNWYNGLQ